jgi:hypothetical protein
MRGNHRIWGRQDYTEPPPLPSADLSRVAACSVKPRTPDRNAPHNWHEVRVGGVFVGYVTTRMGGQSYRLPDWQEWFPAASDWHPSDPTHAHAILCLLDAAEIDAGVPA